MRPDPIGQSVIHGADVQIDGLDAAKGPFHQGERLVAAHCFCVVEGLRWQAGADDIDAVGCRLGGNFSGLACKAEAGIGDVEIEMLGTTYVC